MPDQGITDLTTESPAPLAIDTLDSSVNPSRDGRKPKRKKKSSNSKASSSPGTPEEVPSTLSLSDSNEPNAKSDHSTKRKRIRDASGFCTESNDHKPDSGEPDKSDGLFFVDLSPTVMPSMTEPKEPSPTTNVENKKVEKLLLPSHVTVFGNTLVEIIPQPLSDSDDDEFIKYLDYEDTRNVQRYYDEPPDQTAALDRTVCKNCGAEGEHKTSACPVQICLTCGARNEHSTRSCPISKVCFTCGMKGHINANCPNRHSGRNYTAMRDDDCSRCSSAHHKTNECPTWWRLYEYLASEDQTRTFARRLSRKGVKLGQGGEGYVADDEWCYNCGNSGHWGDDCYELSNTRSLGEYSAFSNHNVMTGPFYDPNQEPKSPSSRSRTRDWEQVDQMFNWGKDAPDRVGRQARVKSMAALEQKSRQAEDDPDDWFGKKSARAPPRYPPREPKKMSFGKSFTDERQYAPPADRPPSLLTRLGGDYHHSNSRSHDINRHSEGRQPPRRSRNKNDHRHQREERSGSSALADGHRKDIPTGPRYRGGYAR
ncbi:hypothetical protein BYT27DRAFT_7182901 [Phlegmacium glaucopus]|nr:hypothetical protein BYT27DRAFT_7182901 [Phlegmacium glaucopus]